MQGLDLHQSSRGHDIDLCDGRPNHHWNPSIETVAHQFLLGVSRDESESCFGETETGCAIFFKKVEDVSPGVALSEICNKAKGFRSPQVLQATDGKQARVEMFRSLLGGVPTASHGYNPTHDTFRAFLNIWHSHDDQHRVRHCIRIKAALGASWFRRYLAHRWQAVWP